jgi:hypothetical protein
MNEQLRLVDGDGVAQPIVDLATCEQCGEQFASRAGSGGKPQRFCSSQCRQRWHDANPNVAQRGDSHVGGADGRPGKEPFEEKLASGLPIGGKLPSGPHDLVVRRDDPDHFDWIHDESIVLKEQPATAIYRNRENSVIIRQQAAWDRDEDSFVFITEQNAMAFLDQLCDLMGIAEFGGPKKPRGASGEPGAA